MSTVPHGEPCQAGPVRYELLRSSRRTAAPKRFLAPVMVTAAGVRPMRAAKWAVRAGRTSRALQISASRWASVGSGRAS